MPTTPLHSTALSTCARLHKTQNQFFGTLLKRQTIKIFTKLILYQIRKYQGIMVLLISLNIDCSEGTDLRLIFKNRCVRFMTDFKMATSKRVPS